MFVAARSGEVAFGQVHVWHQDRNAHDPAFVQVTRRFVEAALNAREQRGHVLDRVVRLEKGDLECHEAVAVAVALVERVVGERFDLLPPFFADFCAVTGVDATLDEADLFFGHDLANFLTAGLTQIVGFGQRVARKLLRNTHHGLLINHESVGAAQHIKCVVVQERDFLSTVFAVGVVVVHVHGHRARPI